MKLSIQGRFIGQGQSCFIIAEAGSNHDGKVEQARSLIDIAADSGADAVKFQLFRADKIAARSKSVIISEERFTDKPVTLNEFYRSLEFQLEWLQPLKEYAERRGLVFLMTPFDEESADRLHEFGIAAFKVASYELTHLPLLRHLAAKGLPILLSTGMADWDEIDEALATIRRQGECPVALLHCGIDYPLQFGDVHLNAMRSMMERYDCPVGYSDHTLGWTVPVAAAALGAKLYEKHFTIDTGLSGPDHKFALGPRELKSMVRAIRDCEAAMGSPEKEVRPAEMVHYRRGRRSLHAARPIRKGEVLEESMIAVLRPGTGLPPRCIPELLGSRAAIDIEEHEPIVAEAIER